MYSTLFFESHQKPFLRMSTHFFQMEHVTVLRSTVPYCITCLFLLETFFRFASLIRTYVIVILYHSVQESTGIVQEYISL